MLPTALHGEIFEKRVDVDRMHEMSSLAVTFNKMAEELQKYEETRSSFVANVSRASKPADLYSGLRAGNS